MEIKRWGLVLSCVAALSAVSCGDASDATEDESTQEEEVAPKGPGLLEQKPEAARRRGTRGGTIAGGVGTIGGGPGGTIGGGPGGTIGGGPRR